ncbi:MAG: 6-bladed beta-propeller [Tannerellaceae bacterium]|nr:6-bladed beta-propeller [Tannerellaceae bacterium]
MIGAISCNGNKKENSFNKHLSHAEVIAQKEITENGDTIILADLPKDKRQIAIPLSSLLSSFRIVQLENSDEALTFPGNIAISENYIGIFSYEANAYKLYDREGKYIATITKPGEGPDEYFVAIYDSYIDEINNRIYMIAFRASKILVFDLQGNPQKHIPLPYVTYKGKFQIDLINRKVLIRALPFEDSPAAIWVQDFEGTILQEIPTGHFLISPSDYSNEVEAESNTENNEYHLSYWGIEPRPDTLYHYQSDKNDLKPIFTMDFTKSNLMHTFKELPDQYLVILYPYSGGLIPPRYPKVLIDKKTLRGSYIDFKFDMLGDIDGPNYLAFNRGYCISSMDSADLMEQLRSVIQKPHNITPEVLEEVRKLYGNLTEDDNSIILIGKLKKE